MLWLQKSNLLTDYYHFPSTESAPRDSQTPAKPPSSETASCRPALAWCQVAPPLCRELAGSVCCLHSLASPATCLRRPNYHHLNIPSQAWGGEDVAVIYLYLCGVHDVTVIYISVCHVWKVVRSSAESLC